MGILVIGDVMLDKHTWGSVDRISPEAPVPVIKAKSEPEVSLGAAANVAQQITAAGIECFLAFKCFKTTEHDNSNIILDYLCKEQNIKTVPLVYPDISHPVTTKHRIWAGEQQIARIDFENTLRPTHLIEDNWFNTIVNVISENSIKVVALSDYDKGTLTDRFIQRIATYCQNNDIKTVLDPKRFSFYGLQGLTVIKPNVKEIRSTNLTPEKCSEELEDTYLLNTLGEDGMIGWRNGKKRHGTRAIKPPGGVVDVCGSGDVVCAYVAMGLIKNDLTLDIIRDCTVAAYCNVLHKGCHIVTRKELEETKKMIENNSSRVVE